MIPLVLEHSGWRLSISDGAPGCRLESPVGWLDRDLAVAAVARGRSCSVPLELVAFGGGLRPQALLGAELIADPGTERLTVRFAHTGDLTLGAERRCESPLSGLVVAGLPLEFAIPALEGFLAVAPSLEVPGEVRVDVAGYDEVESSSVVFERAGGLLRHAVAAVASAQDPSSTLRELMTQW